ncbi:MAG: 16S rRNA (guanine(966)-N(2))-methyltransferase RsmD [Chloroflexi bacterium]|nr:16S rRNA (guanine(966)-N(2))-methyltransferase RsmD [Chloroflexota bacterium]
MRISGGEARGLRLHSPQTSAVRPTSDRVRGALFQRVGEFVMDARVLDLYAGTGALGLEALSRGAAWVDFVEQDVRICQVIQDNLHRAGFDQRAHVYRAKVEKALTFLAGPYGLVLLDPPYDVPGVDSVAEALGLSALVEDGGLVILEHSHRALLAEGYGGLRLRERRRYGDTVLSIYRMERA